MSQKFAETTADEWVTFPGGELEGKRPRALCRACREAVNRVALVSRTGKGERRVGERRPLCFQCYRASLERDRALQAAGNLETGSSERFQFQLPLEPVDRERLERLRSQRATERANTPNYVAARRRAQIDARHALQQITSGLRARSLAPGDRDRALFEAVHAAELQLPEAWLPFV
ncbi:MAG TPA: hypothetical protein VF219_17230, partial [Vicinamibacterales bacterium]